MGNHLVSFKEINICAFFLLECSKTTPQIQHSTSWHEGKYLKKDRVLVHITNTNHYMQRAQNTST